MEERYDAMKKPERLLAENAHRPFPIPNKKWNFYHEWNEVVFLHYKISKDKLQEFMPKEVNIDLFEGEAWVSLVAFKMEKIRPKGLFSFPLISNFPELNLRTYVEYKGKQGVYFLSIEAGKRISSFIAATISGLPYQFANQIKSANAFKSSKKENSFEFEYQTGERLNKSSLDKWLTERYLVIQDVKNRLVSFDVHHTPWPIQKLNIKKFEVTGYCNLVSNKPDLAHYSKGVSVLSWPGVVLQ